MAEVDLVNRDPNSIHDDSMNVAFPDVLAEPPSMHSMDCIWQNAEKCYTCGLNLSYKLATLFCGLCLALYWGCCYGCLGFAVIWIITPAFKCLNLVLGIFRRILELALTVFCGPCYETCGLYWSKIKITWIKEG